MATTNLKLVSSSLVADSRRRSPRPITTYYFRQGQRSPIRISRSSSPTAAICAVLRRLGDGEDIKVAEVIGGNGKLLRTLTVHYGRVTITK